MKRSVQLGAAFAAGALIIAACNGDNGDPVDEGEAEADIEDEGAGTEDGEEVFLSIATGGTGGAYFPYGGGMSSMFNSELDNVTASAEATGASVENVRLLHTNEAEVALIQADAFFFGMEGQEDFDEPQDIRAIAWMYPNFVQTTSTDPDISSIEDLAGQRVAVGDAGSAAELSMRLILDALGLSEQDFDSVQRIGFTEMTAAFRNNQIDVGNYVGARGLGALQELASTEDITLISYTQEQMDQVAEAYPFITSGFMPGGTYPGVDEDVELIPTLANFVVVNTNMDRELAYTLTRAIYENQEALEAAHPEGANTTPENIVENTFAPMHPGSIDYFEEIGIELNEEVYPPEWDG